MAPIDDWAAALRCPDFWLSYYHTALSWSCPDGEEPNAVLRWLDGPATGCDPDRLWGPDPYEVITDDMDEDQEEEVMDAAMAAGSVLTIPLQGGAEWSIRFSSAPGIYHRLDHPGWGGGISLGYDDPHFHLPILRWAEVPILVDGIERYWRTLPAPPFPAGFLMPLLVPVVGGVSAQEEGAARSALARAWAGTGMVDAAHARDLAVRLVRADGFVRWDPDPLYGWVNTGPHSHRNPHNAFWGPRHFTHFRSVLDAPAAPRRDHRASAGGPEPLWEFDAGEAVTPRTAAGDGMVAFTTVQGSLRVLDAADGTPRWSAPTEPSGFSCTAPVIDGGMVLHAGGTGSFAIQAFGGRDGADEWAITLDEKGYQVSAAFAGSADCTPVPHEGTLFVAEDHLYALRADSQGATRLWDAYLTGIGSNRRSAPVVGENLVYVALEDTVLDCGRLVPHTVLNAYDRETGEFRWESAQLEGPMGGLVLLDGEVFVPAGALNVLDAGTGARLWTVDTEREWTGAIAVTGDMVVGTACRPRSGAADEADDGERPEPAYTMVGVDRRRHRVAWTFTDPDRLASRGVVVCGGIAYSVGYDDQAGTLYAVDVTTGELRWRYELGPSSALPSVLDGRVFVSGGDGIVRAFA